MSKVNMTIWGRKFELDIIYDCYQGEEVTSIQKDALIDFLGHSEIVDQVLDKVKEYCIANSDGELEGEITNIFKYVIPIGVYIQRSEQHVVGLLCNFRFDIEHGMAIEFVDNKLKEIGSQDIMF